jgi:hypothetical protein
MIISSLGLGERLTLSRVAAPRLLDTRLNAPSSQFERAAVCRGETYVCFRLRATVASRHSVQPEINGPLHGVTPTGPGKRRKGCLIRATGLCCRKAFDREVIGSVYTPTPRSIGNKSVPAFSRTSEQTRTKYPSPLGKACVRRVTCG